MDEQLSKALTELVSRAVNGVDFLSGQLPQVFEDLVKWKMVEAGSTILICLAILALFWTVVRKKWNKAEKDLPETHPDKWSKADNRTLFTVVAILVTGCSLVVIYWRTLLILKLALTPKVWLIDYLNAILNGCGG